MHELRILQGTSIAALLETILEEYFDRHREATGRPHHASEEDATPVTPASGVDTDR